VSAHYDLAVCYETGKGVGKSLKRAFQHYMQAAQQGHDKAAHSVGRMYFHGIGVRKDRAAADIWLDRAEALAPRKR
jgi:TPR repeat protein